MEPGFTYYAFISYSHADDAFAKKVQRYLEHYRVPGKIRKMGRNVPAKIRPVFLDCTDLAIGQLSDKLSQALRVSQYLIVICSEKAAKPNADGKHWIDEEVRTFLSLHPDNTDRIIPVLHRENPDSDARDCLPPSIREKDILAADVEKHGFERVLNDVIAKLLGILPNELKNRHAEEELFRRRMCYLGGLACAAFAALAGWWCWDYYGTHVSYYTDYIERHNLPEGLFELTDDQMEQRHRHYRFTTHRHRLRSVEYCNSAGRLQEHQDAWWKERPAAMLLEYKEGRDGAGEVVACTHLNALGMEVSKRKFSPNCVDFVQTVGVGDERMEVAQSASLMTTLEKDEDVEANSAIGRIFVQRRESGVVVRELFCKANSLTPMVDAQGVGGREYRLDGMGRPVEMLYLAVRAASLGPDTEVQGVENSHGIGGYRFEYIDVLDSPALGRLKSISALDGKGGVAMNEEGWATCRMDYDSMGNLVRESFLDQLQQPCRHKEGYTFLVRTYDENGNEREVACYDEANARCMSIYGFSYRVSTHDERGNCTQQAFYDKDGKLCCRENGFAIVTKQYDEKNRETATAYYGADRKPCWSHEGFSRFFKIYDEASGKLKKEEYYDEHGKPCLNAEGYASAVWTYDGYGKMEKKRFYGTDGKPCVSSKGYASVQWRYGQHGNRTGEAYFDLEGKPCLHSGGYARKEWSYDDKGRLLSITCYDLQGEVVTAER